MRPVFWLLVFLVCSLSVPTIANDEIKLAEGAGNLSQSDWPWWRGPFRNGIADEQDPPLQWDSNTNIRWQAPVPGRGHGSPTLVGNRIYLATADEQKQTQLVLCYDRNTGKQVWQTVIHQGKLHLKSNKKASQASSTVACDGERLFINFLNGGAVFTTALDLSGKQLWQRQITKYVVHQGYGSSPAIYGPLVIVSADNKGGGAICGLDRKTGQVVWKTQRPKMPNYASPVILRVDNRHQLLFSGCEMILSLDPLSGRKLWETKGSTTECVTTMVTDGQLVYTSGGYPKNHMSAVTGDGSKKLVWKNNVRVYVPSMLVYQGFLYAVTDAGVARCWHARSGKELWSGRLGGTFSSSPVKVGDYIFATNERGKTFIFEENSETFSLVATNALGDEVFATPVFSKNQIFMRVAHRNDNQRTEVLYCIAEPETP